MLRIHRCGRLVVRDRMIAVAARGGAAADGAGAGLLPDVEDVLQGLRDPVARYFAGVTAVACLDGAGLEPAQPGGDRGQVGDGWWGPARAAVPDRVAGRIGEREAPSGAGGGGDLVGEVAAGLGGGPAAQRE